MTDGSGPLSPPRRLGRRRVLRRAGKALLATMALLIFLATATGWATTQWLDRQLRDVLALDPQSAAITDANAQRGDENILLVGSDTRAGAQRADNVGDTTVVRGARSDTVMIAHLPADRSRVVVVSFPRDLQIRRPPCEIWDPGSGAYTGQFDPGAEVAKLNTAYEIGGPLCVTKVVQYLSGLAVTRFVGVDFQGFKAVVDAVGGVPICVDDPLQDQKLGVVIPQAGTSTISGNTALNFVRARYVVGDPTGDYGRIGRQQRFLSALLRKVLSPAVLLNPGRFRAVVEAVTANTVGQNIRASALLGLGQSIQGLDPAQVTFVTVPTTGGANKYGNEELRVKDNAALFRAIIDGAPMPGEPPADGPGVGVGVEVGTGGLPDPAQVQVRVLNAAGIAGAAARAGRALQAAGFGVLEVGNAEALVDSTAIRYPPHRQAEALTLFAALPESVLQPDQRLVDAVVLLVGPDFDGTISSGPAVPTGPSRPDQLATVNAADTTCS